MAQSSMSEGESGAATGVEPGAGRRERVVGRGATIAIVVVGLLLLALSIASVGVSGSASYVVLPSSAVEGIAITLADLPDFPLRTSTRAVRSDRGRARISVSFEADESAPGAGRYPGTILQFIEYENDVNGARRSIELGRSSSRTNPDRTALPVRPGRREASIARIVEGPRVVFDVYHLLNNIVVNTTLVGDPATLTEDRALEIVDITLKKYDKEVRSRTRFTDFPVNNIDLVTIVDPLTKVSVPLIGFVLVILFYPSGERSRLLQLNTGAAAVVLAAVYAFLLWKSIYISGSGNTILFVVEGWPGLATVCLTAVVAALGVRLLWWRPLPQSPGPDALGWLAARQTSCPHCKRLSPAASTRCEHCGQEFGGRA
jgi:hypothetical protein